MRLFTKNPNMVLDFTFDLVLVEYTVKNHLPKLRKKPVFDILLLMVFWVYLRQSKNFEKFFYQNA